METACGLLVCQRIHVWIYGDIVERWRAGKLDDRQFRRAYRLRAQLLGLPMLVPIALAGIGSWLDRDVSVIEHLTLVGYVALIVGTAWLVRYWPVAPSLQRHPPWRGCRFG